MKLLILISFCIIPIFSLSYTDTWRTFKESYGKSYNLIEERTRYKIFHQNLRKIYNHNKRYDAGQSSYKLGITEYADLTEDEFINKLKLRERNYLRAEKSHQEEFFGKIPDEIDWREKGAVTEIKNQGSIGISSAFSVTGTVEGANFISTGKLISLSEANLADCVKDPPPNEGDWRDKAFEYAEINGIESEDNYPINSDGKCKYNASEVAAKINNFTYVKQDDELELQKIVAIKGPVSVNINVTPSFQFYISGVFNDDTCSSDQLNHSVLVVGYGFLNEKQYWIVKNSWGISWGMDGYILMSRNQNNQCGIARSAVYATV